MAVVGGQWRWRVRALVASLFFHLAHTLRLRFPVSGHPVSENNMNSLPCKRKLLLIIPPPPPRGVGSRILAIGAPTHPLKSALKYSYTILNLPRLNASPFVLDWILCTHSPSSCTSSRFWTSFASSSSFLSYGQQRTLRTIKLDSADMLEWGGWTAMYCRDVYVYLPPNNLLDICRKRVIWRRPLSNLFYFVYHHGNTISEGL